MKVGGIDLGLVRNSTTFVALEGDEDGSKLIFEREWRPGRTTLLLHDVLPAIEMLSASIGIVRLGHDQHYAQAVVEHFDMCPLEIELVRTPAQISPLYLAFRRSLEREEIDLSTASKRMQDQLAHVAYHVGANGGVLIDLPKMPDGSHCDLVAGLLASWNTIAKGKIGRILGAGDRKIGRIRTERYGSLNGNAIDEEDEG